MSTPSQRKIRPGNTSAARAHVSTANPHGIGPSGTAGQTGPRLSQDSGSADPRLSQDSHSAQSSHPSSESQEFHDARASFPSNRTSTESASIPIPAANQGFSTAVDMPGGPTAPPPTARPTGRQTTDTDPELESSLARRPPRIQSQPLDNSMEIAPLPTAQQPARRQPTHTDPLLAPMPVTRVPDASYRDSMEITPAPPTDPTRRFHDDPTASGSRQPGDPRFTSPSRDSTSFDPDLEAQHEIDRQRAVNRQRSPRDWARENPIASTTLGVVAAGTVTNAVIGGLSYGKS
jgi:hypothetical protein